MDCLTCNAAYFDLLPKTILYTTAASWENILGGELRLVSLEEE
jgi:hypothetical protein